MKSLIDRLNLFNTDPDDFGIPDAESDALGDDEDSFDQGYSSSYIRASQYTL
ncbi:MAG: hypothetical protein RL557_911 [archaeon]|jgi:hypothetical protein